jgi:hypothetical protein
MLVTVHIAAAPANGQQLCSRCGKRLDPGEGCMTMDGDPLRPWTTDAFIGFGEGFAVQMSHDAEASDEVRCGSRPA